MSAVVFTVLACKILKASITDYSISPKNLIHKTLKILLKMFWCLIFPYQYVPGTHALYHVLWILRSFLLFVPSSQQNTVIYKVMQSRNSQFSNNETKE